jgi:hypothetical protein
MAARILEFVAGLLLAGLTLRDVFDTVVVPGGSQAILHVARRLSFLLLPVWRRARGRGRGVSTSFAPFILVLSFFVWMILLALGFALMAYPLRDSFSPPLKGFADAVFVVGTGLVTIGFDGTTAGGAARWLTLASAFCGLAVMTMAVTYLLEVQSSIARRDAGILKLRTSAGDPPSAMRLLENYGALGCRSELRRVLEDGREWCASVRQSHVAHPSLIYFRSLGTGAGWPAALGALLDLALIVELFLDDRDRGAAILLREDGTRMASDLADVLNLDRAPPPLGREEVDGALRRLAEAGYEISAAAEPECFLRLRTRHSESVAAIAAHLGTPPSAFLPRAGGDVGVSKEAGRSCPAPAR